MKMEQPVLMRATSRWQDWPVRQLAASKRRSGVTVSVVIPARNEERTVGQVARGIARLSADTGLVDELVVIDSDSTDRTFEVAAMAGATVYRARDVAPQLDAFPGKGEALWKSLLVTRGDLLVFVDADLTHWGPHFVTGLLGPLLADEGVLLVKGFYQRLYAGDDGSVTADGGRVTELVARPLLSLWWPELTGIVQPLAGEWAARRDLMESLPVPVGYGVELAVLLDTAREHGLDAIAQVDLGSRGHKHQATHDLALMAAELLLVADRRRGAARPAAPDDRVPDDRVPDDRVPDDGVPDDRDGPGWPGDAEQARLYQFTRSGGETRQYSRPVPARERPPARLVKP
jgi:glucosyl-3-phosphoglycerate synthase